MNVNLASLSVGTLNLFVLWLRSFVAVYGSVFLAMTVVGIVGQTHLKLQDEAFYAALAVMALVAVGLAIHERDRRRALLDALGQVRPPPRPFDRS